MSNHDHTWIGLHGDGLPEAEIARWIRLPQCGAVATFTGVIRDHNAGHDDVTHLDYEAYESPTEEIMLEVADLVRHYWPSTGRIAIVHRTGRVAVTESAVVCSVSAPHRREAIAAMNFCIDVLKSSVPIWKTEHGAQGTQFPDNGGPIQSVSDAAVAWWREREQPAGQGHR